MLCVYVGDVQGAMFMHPAMPWIISADLYTDTRYRTKMSARNHAVALAESQNNVVNTANLSGALDNRLEHWLHVRWRTADDPEHLGRRCLMLQSLAQFGVALLQFFEQPHVLDGDHCLRCKGLQQRHLLVSKGPHLRAADVDHADGRPFTQQRCCKKSSDTTRIARIADRPAIREPLRLRYHVSYVYCSPL